MKSKTLIESSRTPDGFYRRILFLDYFQAGIYRSELADSDGEWISAHIFRNKRDAWKHYRSELVNDFFVSDKEVSISIASEMTQDFFG